ncbi:MAG: hypothetical protein WDZ40_01015 [Candidatus Spechtbacterales bacterium]
MDITDIFKAQAFLSFTWDIVVVFFIFVAGVLYGMNAGRKNLTSFALSVYGSIVLLEFFPYREWFVSRFPGLTHGVVNLVLLFVFTFFLYYVFSGTYLKLSFPKMKRRKGPFWQVVFLSVALAGFLTSLLFNDINLLFGREVSPFMAEFFLSSTAAFVWAAAPLVAIAVSRKV